MPKELPLVQKIYFCPESTAVARAIGYRGVQYRDLWPIIEELSKQFPKVKVESAIDFLTTYEGQMRCNLPPLAQVMFREEVRPLMWQLLGPPPGHPLREEMDRLKEPPPETEETQAEKVKKPRKGRGR
jgi:hypothetical protein